MSPSGGDTYSYVVFFQTETNSILYLKTVKNDSKDYNSVLPVFSFILGQEDLVEILRNKFYQIPAEVDSGKKAAQKKQKKKESQEKAVPLELRILRVFTAVKASSMTRKCMLLHCNHKES